MNAPTRKVMIVPAWYPNPAQPIGGIFVHDQAQCLASRHDVTVVTPELTARESAPLTKEVVDGVHVWRVAPPPERLWQRLWSRVRPPTSTEAYYRQFWTAARRGFQHHVREHGKPDILHAHVVLPAGWIALQLGRQWRIPVVLTEHSDPFSVHLQTAWQRKLVRQTLVGVDRCLAVSPALAEIMARSVPERTPEVFGNVVRTDFFTPAPCAPAPRFRFLAVALLSERKGIQHLLEAVALLRDQGLDAIELTIGGDGPMRVALEKLADDLHLRGHCRFLGSLDRTQVRDEMRRCDALVAPSLSETFCLVLCEAMACGKPVIATRCGGPEFTVTPETGVLVPVGAPRELAKAMAEMLDGQRSFDARRIAASVRARFGVDAWLEQLESIYTETIQRGKQSARAA